MYSELISRATCWLLGLAWLYCAAASSPDIRISKGMRQRGYDWVRISVIDRGEGSYGSFFDYTAPFQHAWEQFHLHSAMKPLVNGTGTFTVGDHTVSVKIPQPGERTRGFFIADPCISNAGGFACNWAAQFQTKERIAGIVNMMVASPEIDFWAIIGDNFYESNQAGGGVTKSFFDMLSDEVKAKPFLTVPGNHDFWIGGLPPGQTTVDQFGYGFMQMNGQDTEQGLKGMAPYDFSVPPAPNNLPLADDFAFSHQIGDIAFFGYSGAHDKAQVIGHLSDFCTWLSNVSTVRTAVLLGHWNTQNLGCKTGMDAPDLYTAANGMPGCSGKVLVFVDGHEHCNYVHPDFPDHGFLIGGNGQYGGSCKRQQFGFMVMESDPDAYMGPHTRVDYFEISNLLPSSRQVYTIYGDSHLNSIKAGLKVGTNELTADIYVGPQLVRKGTIVNYSIGGGASIEMATTSDLPKSIGDSSMTFTMMDIRSNWTDLTACIQAHPAEEYTGCRENFATKWRAVPERPSDVKPGHHQDHVWMWIIFSLVGALVVVLTAVTMFFAVRHWRRYSQQRSGGSRLLSAPVTPG